MATVEQAVRPQQHRAGALCVGRRCHDLQRGHLRTRRVDDRLLDLLRAGRVSRCGRRRGADPRRDHQHPGPDHVRAARGEHAEGWRRLCLGQPRALAAPGADLQPLHDHGRPPGRRLLRQVLLAARARAGARRPRVVRQQQHVDQLGDVVPDQSTVGSSERRCSWSRCRRSSSSAAPRRPSAGRTTRSSSPWRARSSRSSCCSSAARATSSRTSMR